MHEPPLTLGMEEEYLLVNLETRAVETDPPAQLFEDLRERTSLHAFREFMRSQIEITTPVCRSVGEARIQLGELRRAVVEESARYGLAPIAASSHPFSLTAKQQRTDKERYLSLLEEMQGAIRRMMICGLHVHVGVDDDEARVDLLNQLPYFLPHLLALSCSSPFCAMRYSFDGGLLDLGTRKIVAFPELLDELIEVVREDAEALGCVAEVEGLRRIVERGTSAHRQVAVYEAALESGGSEMDALRSVVDWLVEETRTEMGHSPFQEERWGHSPSNP